MLRVENFRSISSIPANVWDGILSVNDVFNTHQFITVVEEARVENASFYYMLFYDESELVGHVVLSSFSISLDLFISKNKLVRRIKRVFPDLFSVKILFCGLPVSFGQSNIKVKHDTYMHEITGLIIMEMEKIAVEEKINLLCAKEFKGNESGLYTEFPKSNFFKAYSLPYMKMVVPWSSFTEYLKSMRHPYRRGIRLSLLKSKLTQPKIYLPHESFSDYYPVLVLGDITLLSAQDFYVMYLSVMDRTPTKLETLNLQFFQGLQRHYQSKMEILKVQQHGKILSAGILIQHQNELTFVLVGRNQAKDDAHSYFNLVYGIIQLAISRGLDRINLGQTAYWVKQRIGGEPTDVFIYFKSRNPFTNWILKKLNHVIFPKLNLKELKVFHAHRSIIPESKSGEMVVVKKLN
ncbi:peptidogalycan biosysnthesis protein [Aquiflexum sp.]|uniref:peptidogalycan biosysnthesis protein n=1 Tax=Aquiflexum sp. TaxID=1872584 RepID=UPI0035933EB9